MDQIVISASNLTKTFLGKEVIRNCTFSVERGSIYGFLGRNGAGKTTVLKLLLGLLKPSAGTASVLGLDSVRDNEAILRRTGSLIETPIFYEHLSAADNLRLHLAYMGIEDTDVEPTLCRVGLPGTGSQPVSTFSLGMRQRLAIARAIIHVFTLAMCAQPAGQIIYGALFDWFSDSPYWVLIPSGLLVCVIGLASSKFFVNFEKN